MKFNQLPIGALFKFFEGGSLLTKTGTRTYAAPQWGHEGLHTNPEKEVIVQSQHQ